MLNGFSFSQEDLTKRAVPKTIIKRKNPKNLHEKKRPKWQNKVRGIISEGAGRFWKFFWDLKFKKKIIS